VRLADGRDQPAQLVGVSPAHDIAVLRIAVKGKPPPPVLLGTSADLRVGQRVYAIGNPFGLDWSLTTGVVSALDRSLPTDAGVTIEHVIQTDAAINRGNSGGPLLDSAGRLIGMNAAILSPSGASAGIGFAVPADTINRVVPQLIRTGKYARPVLGVEADESVNRLLAQQYKVRGVVILKVTPNSAAAKAGLRAATVARDGSVTPGDIIVEIEGQPVDSVGKLIGRLDDFKVGDTIRLGVLRKGARVEVRATLQGVN
jgi:S1-C subfamily serine protease